MTLDVAAPTALAIVQGSYTPNPFTITATVANTSAAMAEDVALTIWLPAGLTLAAGSATQAIGDLPAGQQHQVSWSVLAAGQHQDTTPTYFVSMTSSNAPGKSVTRQITLPGGALTVASSASKFGGNTGPVTIHVNGGGMLDGATARLIRTGQPDIVSGAISVASDGFSLTATFDLKGQPKGVWDVVVTNPNGNAGTLASAFTIETGRTSDVWVNIVGPQAMRVGRPSVFYIVYGNRSNVDAVGVPIWISLSKDVSVKLGFEITPPPLSPGPDHLQPRSHLLRRYPHYPTPRTQPVHHRRGPASSQQPYRPHQRRRRHGHRPGHLALCLARPSHHAAHRGPPGRLPPPKPDPTGRPGQCPLHHATQARPADRH
ncbi:MAG: DUF11 domain-containing protein [Candidatus Tectomicrobia bacterium]|uniref:DUF11 domain-containing protein n=1 Tax=Tectimicrobiota bacterium TaxID=2528274 RepID=A0A938B614_UNCTE|nr:DUF11 domain-containing protein [Candidatus Tectomicrobia bacterium]